MKRFVMIAVIAALVGGTAPQAAHANTFRPRHNRHDNIVACPQKWWHGWRANRRLVVCEAKLFGLYSTGVCIARWESGFQWWEAYAGNLGTFQISAWGPRFVQWGGKAGGFINNWRNSRSNTFVAMRWAKADGWWAWSTYRNHCGG